MIDLIEIIFWQKKLHYSRLNRGLRSFISFLIYFSFLCYSPILAISFGDRLSSIEVLNNSTLNINSTRMQVLSGRVKKDTNATIQGAPILMSNGIYSSGSTDMTLTGSFQRDAAYNIILNGSSQILRADSGSIAELVLVRNRGSSIEGQPRFTTSNAIQLKNGVTDLTLSINNTLDQNIVMNGGTLILGNDLKLGSDVVLSTSGTINANGHRLTMVGTPLTIPNGNFDWLGDPVIEFGSKIILPSNNTWTFHDSAIINGNGNLLDASLFKIWVKAGATVSLNNVKMRGIDNNSFVFENKSSQIRLSNVSLEMDDSVTITIGGFYVEGQTTIVTKEKLLTFDLLGSMTVDGVPLTFEQMGANGTASNIHPTKTEESTTIDGHGAHISYFNQGYIRRLKEYSPGDLVLNTQNSVFTENTSVSLVQKMQIPDNATIDGKNLAITFTKSDEPLIIVDPGKTLVFTNVLLNDFQFGYIGLGEGSSVVFGDNTKISLFKSDDLTSTFTFQGSCILDGKGKSISLAGNAGIVIAPNSSLLLDSVVLKNVTDNQIRCLDNKSTLSVGNVDWRQDGTFSFTVGHFEVLDTFKISGAATFAYQSSQKSTITAGAKLSLEDGAVFSYEPSTSNRDLLAFENEKSTLTLSNGSLASTTTGIRLTKGTLALQNSCFLQNDGANSLSESISFGNGNPEDVLTVVIGPSATLELLSGKLIYDNQE